MCWSLSCHGMDTILKTQFLSMSGLLGTMFSSIHIEEYEIMRVILSLGKKKLAVIFLMPGGGS